MLASQRTRPPLRAGPGAGRRGLVSRWRGFPPRGPKITSTVKSSVTPANRCSLAPG